MLVALSPCLRAFMLLGLAWFGAGSNRYNLLPAPPLPWNSFADPDSGYVPCLDLTTSGWMRGGSVLCAHSSPGLIQLIWQIGYCAPLASLLINIIYIPSLYIQDALDFFSIPEYLVLLCAQGSLHLLLFLPTVSFISVILTHLSATD